MKPLRPALIIILGLVVSGGVIVTIISFQEFETYNDEVNLWCAEEFDKAIARSIDPIWNELIENYCFTNFEGWKDSSISLNDGTAELFLNEKGMTVESMVQHNILRESELD